MNYVRRGDGPAFVMVHGFLSGWEYWEKQIDSLSDAFEVISFDNVGYGHRTEELGRDSVNQFARDILDQLDQLGITDFHLIGHSMGGMIAQEISLIAPERVNRLVLFGTGPRGDLPGRFEPLEVSMKKAQEHGVVETKRYTVASWFRVGEQHPEYEPGLRMASSVSLETFINGLKAMAGWSATGRLNQIKSPTLVIWGDLDRSYTWEYQPFVLWREIPECNLAVMPNCSHNAHLENPELFNKLLRDFLQQAN